MFGVACREYESEWINGSGHVNGTQATDIILRRWQLFVFINIRVMSIMDWGMFLKTDSFPKSESIYKYTVYSKMEAIFEEFSNSN